jgi:hypothetical protein
VTKFRQTSNRHLTLADFPTGPLACQKAEQAGKPLSNDHAWRLSVGLTRRLCHDYALDLGAQASDPSDGSCFNFLKAVGLEEKTQG